MEVMQLVWLAQLYKAKNLTKEQKLELSRKININYYIPDETYRDLENKSYTGYNCLHIAAMTLDSDLIHDFVNRGACVFLQGTQNGKTPLHIAVDVKTNGKGKHVWEISGKLQYCKIVNTLLLEHVKSNYSFNPKCHKDMSHLHIACMFNCVEAVQFFLKRGELINQVTKVDAHWPSYTSLHFAIRYSSVETAELLLTNGADLFNKDAEGVSSLHLLINRLLNIADYVNMGQRAFHVPYEEELKRLEKIVCIVLQLKRGGGRNFIDDTGLTAAHLACIVRITSIAKSVLNDSLDVNVPVKDDSTFWPGWTLLHFAACSSVETVKLLMGKGADITIKNKRGETPLDMCLKRYNPETVNSILSIKDDFRKILLTNLTDTFLDLILAMNDMKSFKNYLELITEADICVFPISPLLPAYSLLHLALSMNERTKSWNDFVTETDCQENANSLSKVHSGMEDESRLYLDRIEACLKRGCSVTFKNLDGLTPIHLAFKTHISNQTILAKLFSYCAEDTSDPDNLTHLHIACASGNHEAVRALLHAGANINSTTSKSFVWCNGHYRCPDKAKPYSISVSANSTPLHLAVAFEHVDVVKILLEKGADVHAVDSETFTPIHLSLARSNGSNDIAEVIVSQSGKLTDLVSKEGLSHLHVAAFAGDADAIEKLIHSGADVNHPIDASVPDFLSRFAGKTPLQMLTQTASAQISRDKLALAITVLIDFGADIYANDNLQCLMDDDVDLSDCLVNHLKHNENVNVPIDSSGLTLLHVACGNLDVDWAMDLLCKGADVNARIRSDDDYRGRWKGYTPLHALVLRRDRGDTLGELLLNWGADSTIDSVDGTPLHLACHAFMKDSQTNKCSQGLRWRLDSLTLNMLKSQKSHRINPTNADGLSHFHCFCMADRTGHNVERYLMTGIDINHPTNPFSDVYPGYTALHFAFARGSFEVVKLLTRNCVNLGIENANGDTPYHLMFSQYLTRAEISHVLSLPWLRGDVFVAKNLLGQTPIDVLLTKRNFKLQEFRCLLKVGSRVTFRSGSSSSGPVMLIMKNATKDKQVRILNMLVSDCGVGRAVEHDAYDPISEIIAAQRTLSESQTSAFTFQILLDVIQQLVDMGCEIYRPYDKGDTGLRKFIMDGNVTALSFWLRLGADVNSCDPDGRMFEAFEYPNVTVQLLARHVQILKALGLHVSHSWDSICSGYTSKFPLLVGGANCEIKAEYERAKSVKVTEHLTVRTFLSEVWAVSRYPRLTVIQREDIDVFFKRIKHLHQTFPGLCGFMMLQYKKALIRSELVESAKGVLVTERIVAMPDLCTELLFSYFSNDELKYLIENSKGMERPCKRPKIE